VAIRVSVNLRDFQLARTGKDGAEIFVRKSEPRSDLAFEYEKLVATGSNSALNTKKIAKRRASAQCNRMPVIIQMIWVCGPLASLTQSFARNEVACTRFG